ncbi:MAG: GNAT family N-acetyltransferase [Rhizobiales bacterium]|nr:GNAT family N-acetyltransferase [Hyphomicrobiales bacterium]
MIAIRLARPGDGQALWQTTRALAESHDHLDAFVATPVDFEQALFSPSPLIGALVATWNGELAGTAIWQRSFSSFRGKETMYLEDLSVLPPFRKRGIGRALLREVAKVAVSRNIPGVAWLVMDWNDKARGLYEKIGAEIEPGHCFCRLHGDALKALAA